MGGVHGAHPLGGLRPSRFIVSPHRWNSLCKRPPGDLFLFRRNGAGESVLETILGFHPSGALRATRII